MDLLHPLDKATWPLLPPPIDPVVIDEDLRKWWYSRTPLPKLPYHLWLRENHVGV